ncbi:hypothetical protein HMN09_00974000 [Mycena chlorophos]|uniref:Uncharacterized protein n=1 Tax=Mycena chlorophos TaxID=658473 RepID=A0A8H6SJ16_MYCCL|nr:hypothetical protein HMN09_00974000 [Mycena chlorophos]
MSNRGPPPPSLQPGGGAHALHPHPPQPPPPARYAPPSQRPTMLPQQQAQQRRGPSPGVPPQNYPGGQPQRRPSQPYQQPPPPQLQRQPSAPTPDASRPLLQRQPSRPNQPQYPPQQHHPQPPMPDNLPMPAFMPPSRPGMMSPSDSQATLSTLPSSSSRTEDMLIRGTDDDLQQNDLFWRRFNASAANAQLPDAEKSSWLEKNEGKSSRYYRLLWILGVVFVVLAAGGIAIGIYLSFHSNSNIRPDTLGGQADNTSAAGAVAATAGGDSGGTTAAVITVDGTTIASSLHVSPTNTVA